MLISPIWRTVGQFLSHVDVQDSDKFCFLSLAVFMKGIMENRQISLSFLLRWFKAVLKATSAINKSTTIWYFEPHAPVLGFDFLPRCQYFQIGK